MDISSVASSVQAARPQNIRPVTPSPQAAVSDGADRENDGDRDDGSVTATRGNNVNVLA
ncbi:MAG: hypothetical protein JKY17_05295 [Magnetovibrio sp.]|nr:hypothetical protein [Magnetovibrio sp.]